MLVFKYGLYMPIKIIDKAGKVSLFLVMYIAIYEISGKLLGLFFEN